MAQPLGSIGFGEPSLNSVLHEFVSEPISRSRSPAEDQDKEFVVMCRTPLISRADLPTRTRPETRKVQLTACKTISRTHHTDLFREGIRRMLLSLPRADGVHRTYHLLFVRDLAVFRHIRGRANYSGEWGETPRRAV